MYYLDILGKRIPVCFKSTLDETDRFLQTVASKNILGMETLQDLRGKRTPANKLSAEKNQELLDHINSFSA